MFIAALLTIAKLCKQPHAPPDEWIKKMWYLYTMVFSFLYPQYLEQYLMYLAGT
jgi:hypothetical protein